MMADLSQLNSRLVSHMRSLHIRPRRHLTALVVALWGSTAAMVWQEPDSVGSWLSIVLVLFIVSYALLTIQISWRSPQRWWQVNWRTADSELPVLHRLTIIYLMLPVMIWLLGWFHWWLGIPATVLLGLGLWKALSGSWRPSVRPAMLALLLVVTLARIMRSVRSGLFDFNTGEWLSIPATALLVFALWKALSGSSSQSSIRPATLALLVVAAGWVMLTAAGGLFDINNPDWLDHRTISSDLSRSSWPVYLPTALSDEQALLRYYLGYFMVPGLVGRWFGPAVLDWVVPLWTWLGVALALLLFTRSYRGWRIILAAAVLISFSGMDVARTTLLEGWGWIELSVNFDGWPWFKLGSDHLEWDKHYNVETQYSSNMTALMWVPQHFIPAALYTLILFQLRRQRRFLAVSGVVLAGGLFWSPFVALGLLPLVAILVIENGPRPFLRWQNLLLAVSLAGLLTLYLTSGAVDFPRGWLWEKYEWQLLNQWLPIFYLTEFLLLAYLLLLLRPQLHRDRFFLVSLATLLLLPLYHYGSYNVLLLRASLPALLLLCCCCVNIIVEHGFDITKKHSNWRVAFAGLVIALGVGAFTPLIEVMRASGNIGVLRYTEWDTTLLDLPLEWQRENTAHNVPVMLGALLRNDDRSQVDIREKTLADR